MDDEQAAARRRMMELHAKKEEQGDNLNDVLPGAIEEAIKAYDAENVAEPLHQPNVDFSQWPGVLKDDFYNEVAGFAEKIEQRAVRPRSRVVQKALRQREQVSRRDNGHNYLSTYNPRVENTSYGATTAAKWGDEQFVDLAKTGITEHTHSREGACYPDVIYTTDDARVRSTADVPPRVRRHTAFRYAALDPTVAASVSEMTHHDTAIGLENGVQLDGVTDKVSHFLRTIRDTGLSFVCVNVRLARCADLVFSLESTRAVVAVFRFKLVGSLSINTFCDDAIREIERSRAEQLKVAARPKTLNSRSDTTALQEEFLHMQQLALLSYADYRTAKSSDTKHERAVAASGCLMSVWKPRESEALLNLRAEFMYMYFSACQCCYTGKQLKQLLPGDQVRDADFSDTCVLKSQSAKYVRPAEMSAREKKKISRTARLFRDKCVERSDIADRTKLGGAVDDDDYDEENLVASKRLHQ